MDKAVHVTASPNKTNIRLGLCQTSNNTMDCFDWLINDIKIKGEMMQPVLIYCQTLKMVGKVYAYLKAELQQHAWVNCDPERNYDKLLIGIFHSKTLPQNKERILRSLRGEGSCRVVVATTALGMGLNFQNVSHIVMYGLPSDLETLVQQVGRAGRHGQPAHAILYNTKMYLNIEKEVRELVSFAKDQCIRKCLYAHFEEEPISVQPGHQCCTFCHSMCSCSPGTCAEPIPNYEATQSKTVSLRSRQVSEKDKSLIADLLNDYRTSLINSSTHLYTSQEACTGFSQELVVSVLNHCQYIFDLQYVIVNLPVFKLDHAKEILNIIIEVFGDVDVDVQSVLSESLDEPDLYYGTYFDDADDCSDADDALRSCVSSSESDM